MLCRKEVDPEGKGMEVLLAAGYELSKEVDHERMLEKMSKMKWRGFRLMAIEK
jgi:hypothetical protein